MFALIKTRDSCKLEKATEPLTSKDDDEEPNKDDDDNFAVTPKKVYVSISSKRKSKLKEQEETLSEVVGVVKSMIDNDPMKDLISMVREEMKQSREHDFQLYQIIFNDSMNNHQAARQFPDTPPFINRIPITKVFGFHATTQTVKINLQYHHQKLLMSSKIYFQKVILMALYMIPMHQHHNTKNSTIHYKMKQKIYIDQEPIEIKQLKLVEIIYIYIYYSYGVRLPY